MSQFQTTGSFRSRNLSSASKAGVGCLIIVLFCWLSGLFAASDPKYSRLSGDPATGWSPKSNLCLYESEDALRGFIWSHRGFHSESPGSVDASAESMKALLDKGVRNFDIDVVMRTYPSGKDKCRGDTFKECFVVSHPARYQAYIDANDESSLNKIQTLDSLLNQVEEHFTSVATASNLAVSRNPPPIISIEPKFYGKEELRQLVTLTQLSEFRKKHTALISISQEVQVLIEDFMGHFKDPPPSKNTNEDDKTGALHSLFAKYELESDSHLALESRKSLIGISVRTVPSSQGTDFTWNHDPRWWLPGDEGRLPANVRVGASRSSKSTISGIPFGETDKECCTTTPYYSTKNQQVVFVDHKLLSKRLPSGQVGEGESGDGMFYSVCRRKNTHFVTWVVDEEEDMWRQLQAGVDGIITNYPTRMMTALLDKYQRSC